VLEETIAARAKGNQIRKPADSVLQKSAEQKPIDTRAELAAIAGVSCPDKRKPPPGVNRVAAS
jgi:hypothetical protein